jgi:large subunit ribosomal protein L7e
MEKYAIPNKLPSKQVNILAQRKRRITKPKDTNKRPNKKLLKKQFFENKFKKPEFFIANHRKAERDDRRVKRDMLKHGLVKSFMKDDSLVFVLRHRG